MVFNPVIIPAGWGLGCTFSNREDGCPLPHKVLCPSTVMVPDKAETAKFTVMAFVLAPDVMVAPAGRVQR